MKNQVIGRSRQELKFPEDALGDEILLLGEKGTGIMDAVDWLEKLGEANDGSEVSNHAWNLRMFIEKLTMKLSVFYFELDGLRGNEEPLADALRNRQALRLRQ